MAIVLQRTHRSCVPTEVVSVRPWCHSVTRKVRYVSSRDARKCLVGGRPSLSKATASITCVPTEVVSVRPWCHSITRKVRHVPSRDARKCLVGGRPSPNQRDYAVTFVLQRTHRSCVPTEVVSVRPWCHSVTRKVRYVSSRDARKCLVGGRPSLSKATASITCVPTEVVSVRPWCHSITRKVRHVPSRDARKCLVGGRPSPNQRDYAVTFVLQRTHRSCVPTLSLQSEKESTRE